METERDTETRETERGRDGGRRDTGSTPHRERDGERGAARPQDRCPPQICASSRETGSPRGPQPRLGAQARSWGAEMWLPLAGAGHRPSRLLLGDTHPWPGRGGVLGAHGVPEAPRELSSCHRPHPWRSHVHLHVNDNICLKAEVAGGRRRGRRGPAVSMGAPAARLRAGEALRREIPV